MVPKIENIVKMKMINMNTRINPGIDYIKDWIYRRILGILLIDLSGLKIRNVLRDLIAS